MEWYYIFLVLLGYGIGEFIIGFFFNYKIFMISKENFKIAAFMGSISTMLYALLIASSAYVAQTSLDGAYWFVACSAVAMGIGNFFSALIVPIVSKRLGHLQMKTSEIIVEEMKEDEKY